MKKNTLIVKDILDLPTVAKQFLEQIGGRKILAFDGDMGIGKTTFILALLKELGISETNGSPTYSLVNEYFSEIYGTIHHFDVYRLKNPSEALDIGADEIFDSGGYCFIEWPEKIENLLPDNTIWVYLRRNAANECTISFDL